MYPMSHWRAGQHITSGFSLEILDDVAKVAFGLYDPNSGDARPGFARRKDRRSRIVGVGRCLVLALLRKCGRFSIRDNVAERTEITDSGFADQPVPGSSRVRLVRYWASGARFSTPSPGPFPSELGKGSLVGPNFVVIRYIEQTLPRGFIGVQYYYG